LVDPRPTRKLRRASPFSPSKPFPNFCFLVKHCFLSCPNFQSILSRLPFQLDRSVCHHKALPPSCLDEYFSPLSFNPFPLPCVYMLVLFATRESSQLPPDRPVVPYACPPRAITSLFFFFFFFLSPRSVTEVFFPQHHVLVSPCRHHDAALFTPRVPKPCLVFFPPVLWPPHF